MIIGDEKTSSNDTMSIYFYLYLSSKFVEFTITDYDSTGTGNICQFNLEN